MHQNRFDVAIVGSGFGGSLLALLLARRGKSVILVDRAAHPRFAIGESSTPVADMILAHLALKYDLPRVAPLAQYGSWCRTYPEIKRGRKRGFSYFHHQPGETFQPSPNHVNELLIAASSDNDRCDTHWYRADVDQFFAREAVAAGVLLLERTEVERCSLDDDWGLSLRERQVQSHDVRAKFLVDATGNGVFGRQWLGTRDETSQLLTDSHVVFSHFDNVALWRDLLGDAGARTDDHPFACDDAALHHVYPEGWMYMLRFDHGVVSAGFSLNSQKVPRSDASPDEQWDHWLERYPSIRRQFERANIVDIPGKVIVSDRLQRKASQAAGKQWAALPHAFGFIDALHSSGIAWNLSGIERLAGMLTETNGAFSLAEGLAQYDLDLRRELTFIDRCVQLCYETMPTFPLFVLAVMVYFTATVTYERRRMQGTAGSFLCADDADLQRRLAEATKFIHNIHGVLQAQKQFREQHPDAGGTDPAAMPEFFESAQAQIRQLIEPYNVAGLCNPASKNMYRHTAAR